MRVQVLRYLLSLPLIRFKNDFKQCLNHLSNFIESDELLYYASISHDDDEYNQVVVDEVNKAVLSRIPVLSYTKSKIEKRIFPKLRPNTFYVGVTSDVTYLKSLFDRQQNSTWSTYRQKSLIISDNIKPKEILAYAWSKGFVDVTFLRPSYAIIYQFNPFDKKYTRIKCNSSTVWYPEKMKNLHRHEVAVDILNDPPFCAVERNTSGHLVSSTGAEVKLFQTIAQKLNFQPIYIPRLEDNRYGDVSFLREIKSEELLENIYVGKAEMIANARVCPFLNSVEYNYSCSKTLFFTYTCPVVPIIQTKINLDYQIFIAAACIIAIIMMDLLLANFCHFDRNFWNFPVLICLVLGFTVHAQPKKKSERIVYITLIVLSMTCLVNVFNVLTSFRLDGFEEVTFTNTLDIFKNHLVPEATYDVIPDNTLWAADEFGTEYNTTIQEWNSRSACTKKMIFHKNVTCLMNDMIGQLMVDLSTKKHGRPVMKIARNCLWYGRSKIITARGSPYLRLINDIVIWLRASGITGWLIKRDMAEYKMKEDLYQLDDQQDIAKDQFDISFWMIFVSWFFYFNDSFLCGNSRKAFSNILIMLRFEIYSALSIPKQKPYFMDSV